VASGRIVVKRFFRNIGWNNIELSRNGNQFVTTHVVRLKVFRLKAEGKSKMNMFFRDKAVIIIQ